MVFCYIVFLSTTCQMVGVWRDVVESVERQAAMWAAAVPRPRPAPLRPNNIRAVTWTSFASTFFLFSFFSRFFFFGLVGCLSAEANERRRGWQIMLIYPTGSVRRLSPADAIPGGRDRKRETTEQA